MPKDLQATSLPVAPSFKLKAMKDGGGVERKSGRRDEWPWAAKVLEEAADRLVAAAETGDAKATAQAMRAVEDPAAAVTSLFALSMQAIRTSLHVWPRLEIGATARRVRAGLCALA